MEIFKLQYLNEVYGKENYHAEMSNRSVALEDFDPMVEINSALKRLEKIQTFQPKRVEDFLN
jgi:hypothetical protein